MIFDPAVPMRGRSLARSVNPLREQFLDLCYKLNNAVIDENLLASTHQKVSNNANPGSNTSFHNQDLNNANRFFAQIILFRSYLDSASKGSESWRKTSINSLPLFSKFESCYSPEQLERVTSEFRSFTSKPEVPPLLPYILDPFGKSSRLDVIKDEKHSKERDRRKNLGTFYTPRDVADFLATYVIENLKNESSSILDPSCGSGVFLRSLCRIQKRKFGLSCIEFVTKSLFGFDIDIRAIETASFICLYECIVDGSVSDSNFEKAYFLIRKNFLCVDSTSVGSKRNGIDRQQDFLSLFQPNFIENLFPKIRRGFNAVIGNPPYSDCIGKELNPIRSANFSTFLESNSKNSLTPLFVELATKITEKNNWVCGYVLPLSIMFSKRKQYQKLRALFKETSANWTFQSFDREPHALFGEEVKTRITILKGICSKSDKKSKITTTRLLKFRSEDRSRVFQKHRTCLLSNSDISEYIPKIGEPWEEKLLSAIKHKSDGSTTTDSKKCSISDLDDSDLYHVGIGNTAYNFLNTLVIDRTNYPSNSSVLTNQMKLRMIKLANRNFAYATYAVLSSRISFWLWHITGDGFHVNKQFIDTLPINSVLQSEEAVDNLSCFGKLLWENISLSPIRQKNKGVETVAFDARRETSIRNQIDIIFSKCLGLDSHTVSQLKLFESEITLSK